LEVGAGAYQRLRDLIVSGRLAPGAPLIETDLSRRLGVSRTPIRAALQRLQQEGFVSASPMGQTLRTAVAPLTADDMREVFLMAGALEGAAARLAAGLPSEVRAPLGAELRRLQTELCTAVTARPPDIVRAHDAQVRFHRIFVEAGAGARLLAELDVLQPQAERYQRVYATAMIYAFDEVVREHEAIANAIGEGDPDSAELLVGRSWRFAADRYRQVVTILGERGNW
jgi:DNA-binding GntR family transcriptional regulator